MSDQLIKKILEIQLDESKYSRWDDIESAIKFFCARSFFESYNDNDNYFRPILNDDFFDEPWFFNLKRTNSFVMKSVINETPVVFINDLLDYSKADSKKPWIPIPVLELEEIESKNLLENNLCYFNFKSDAGRKYQLSDQGKEVISKVLSGEGLISLYVQDEMKITTLESYHSNYFKIVRDNSVDYFDVSNAKYRFFEDIKKHKELNKNEMVPFVEELNDDGTFNIELHNMELNSDNFKGVSYSSEDIIKWNQFASIAPEKRIAYSRAFSTEVKLDEVLKYFEFNK
ncbi:hypothetical protein [Pantoea stewartii]|uniref:hypothetical protein n=1 Tax=Pantoea stewartii TaxID=66269 RepID=UPI00197D2A98|nr:hypothetical protein [Pantoea stewartii]